jgi:hypothetical protein
MLVESRNSTNNTGTDEAALGLENGWVGKVMHLHSANDSRANSIIVRTCSDWVLRGCNIVRDRVTGSSFALIAFSATNFSLVG